MRAKVSEKPGLTSSSLLTSHHAFRARFLTSGLPRTHFRQEKTTKSLPCEKKSFFGPFLVTFYAKKYKGNADFQKYLPNIVVAQFHQITFVFNI